jgi:hypothetical protein
MSAVRPFARETCCAFCRRRQAEVMRLIACGDAAICSECLGEAMAALREMVWADPRRIAAGGAGALVASGQADTPRQTVVALHGPPAGPQGGFTGDMCDNCQQFTLVRTGTCLTCVSCGTGAGGCS